MHRCTCPRTHHVEWDTSCSTLGGEAEQFFLGAGGKVGKDRVSVQFISVAQSCLTLCEPMKCSTPGLPVHHQLLKFTQTPVHQVGDAIQPPHPLSSPSPPAFNLSQLEGLFKWVSSSRQVSKVVELQLQHQSFQ